MHRTFLIPATLLTIATWHSSAVAQTMSPDQAQMRPMPRQMMQQPMQHPRFAGPRMQRPPMPEFPSAEELARMAPPEPMTEERIKERFAKRRAAMQEHMERDRKAAEKYAQDFARMQKYRADRLAEIMAQAEDRRKEALKRLDEQEQSVLQHFHDRKQPTQPQAAEKPKQGS